MKKKSIILLKVLVSLLIISLLLYFIGFRKVFETILKINILFLPIIIIIYFLTALIGSINMFILLKPLKHNIPYLKILKFTFLSWAIGVITPAKIGHFSMVYFLKKEGINMGDGAAIWVLDKIISLSMSFIFFVFGFSLFFRIDQLVIAILAILSAASIPAFILFHKKGRYIIKKFVLRKYSIKFSGFSNCLSNYIKKFKRYILMDCITTLIGLVIDALSLLILFVSFNEHTSLIKIMVVRAINVFASLIPITLDGLGIRESIGVFLFGKIGLSAPVVITSYLILIIINYIAVGIIFSFLFERKIVKH